MMAIESDSLLGPSRNHAFEVYEKARWPTDSVRRIFVFVPTDTRLPNCKTIERVAGRSLAYEWPAAPLVPLTLPPTTDTGPVVTACRLPRRVEEWQAIGARVGRSAESGETLDCLVPKVGKRQMCSFLRGVALGAQTARRADDPVTIRLWIAKPDLVDTANETLKVAAQVLYARDLGNEPSNRKSPSWLAEQALKLGQDGLSVEVLHTKDLESLGFGGVLAVGRGSTRSPNVTILTYRGGSDRDPHIVLVGKGVTFDSGGLSLKPPASMPLMKTDMTGAAAVLGTLGAVRDLALPVNVTGIVACAENLPGSSAMRPGDVIRHYSGRTTEVLNTDAEGRLLLADCLAYATAQLAPDFVLDIASLTGSATVGLGRHHAALYSRDDQWADELRAAAHASGDPVWRLPLVDEYESAIASVVADSANTNTVAHVSAGSITAALFLEPFAGGARWAHLDIAGAARAESDRPDCRKGATGYGVSLLTYWLARKAGRRW